MIDLSQAMTFTEAAEKWGLANGNTIRKAVERKRFQENEIRKSGDVWLTTYEAMQRVFGNPKHSDLTISMTSLSQYISQSIYKDNDAKKQLKKIITDIQKAIIQHKTVTITTHDDQEHIVMILKNETDVETFTKNINRYLESVSISLHNKT